MAMPLSSGLNMIVMRARLLLSNNNELKLMMVYADLVLVARLNLE